LGTRKKEYFAIEGFCVNAVEKEEFMSLLNKGFTLVELLLAIVLSSGILMATTAFFAPSIKGFQASTSANELRLLVAHTLESISNDVEASRALYYDPALCYATCMVDTTGANRIYYYWGSGAQANTLFRKQESITNTLSCVGGTTVAQNLDKANSTFSIQRDLLSVTLAGTSANGTSLKVSSSFFPTIQERDVILSEGFECNTLKDGWIITLGSGRTNWSIVPLAFHLGAYGIADSDIGDGTDTSSIEIPIDLSRITAAHLTFSYMNDGTITADDSFSVLLFDGSTWQTVFEDVSHLGVPAPVPVKVDLTPYSLNTNNRIKFSTTLSTAGAHWYFDQILVFTP
jgi:prepilin-type N-terminal cleavage/methylation domain-containing protein